MSITGPTINYAPKQPPTVADLTGPMLARIRDCMSREGMSMRELSRRTGIALATLQRRLHGVHPFAVEELLAVCRILGATPIEIVDGIAS